MNIRWIFARFLVRNYMFALQHIHKSFDDKVILNDISFAVNPGEVIVLIGENGSGKTTLLRIINGELHSDSGTLSLQGEIVGYVPQEAKLGSTIIESFDSDTEDWRINYALDLVGLGKIKTKTPISNLSGGQKTRLAFACILAHIPGPTTLLLDEPTNNMDADGIIWLEDFLKSFHGGVVIVSHDRAFINRVAARILELNDGKVKQYGGNYDFYIKQKAAEYETDVKKYEEKIAEKKRIKNLIVVKKQLAKSGVRQKKAAPDNDKSQSNWKLENAQRSFSGQGKALETRLEKLGDIRRPEFKKHYNVSLHASVSESKLILRVKDICKSYDKTVLDDVSFEIRGGERLHIKGPNGSGKTTLLKIVANIINPDSGTIEVGNNINIGYFSQDVHGLDDDISGFENLNSTGLDHTDIYNEARALGLIVEDLKKKPVELSRGQQAKLEFTKLLLGKNQLLILDEPTNHLDIPTRESIESALQNYRGAILVASHDEYFIKQINVSENLNLNK